MMKKNALVNKCCQMKKIETGQQLREALQPFKLYSVRDLRELIKASHNGRIDNNRIGGILTVATALLETDNNFNYFKKR